MAKTRQEFRECLAMRIFMEDVRSALKILAEGKVGGTECLATYCAQESAKNAFRLADAFLAVSEEVNRDGGS